MVTWTIPVVYIFLHPIKTLQTIYIIWIHETKLCPSIIKISGRMQIFIYRIPNITFTFDFFFTLLPHIWEKIHFTSINNRWMHWSCTDTGQSILFLNCTRQNAKKWNKLPWWYITVNDLTFFKNSNKKVVWK